jgi:uncharacterized membrane protein YagU involved in acid resistance
MLANGRPQAAMKQISRPRAVLIGGLIAGALDLLFALTNAAVNGMVPPRLLQLVASGLLGQDAYAGGWPTALLGLAAHFALSFLWAAIFVTAASRMPRLVARPVLSGAIFGVIVFLSMRLVVLPLSAFPHPVSFKTLSAGLDLLSHMFLFGLPIALAAAKAIRPREAT